MTKRPSKRFRRLMVLMSTYIPDKLLYGMLWHDKPHSSKKGEEEEDNQGIADRNGKAREGIMPKRASLSCWLMRLGRFRVVGIGSEAEQQNAAQYLEIEDCSGLFDEIHHEAHAQTRHHSVDEVAHSSPLDADQARAISHGTP